MGSTRACTVDKSFAAAYGSHYKLDVRSFVSSKGSTLDKIGSSSGNTQNIPPDLGLAVTSTSMEANSYNLQSITLNSSNLNCSTDIKGLKRPDKALPCPRCNSLDTKFCYYNNYNVNQPRHFCKGCQRYWTAGGTLRNVAVGAGRRKRKLSSLESEAVTEASSVEYHDTPVFSATRRGPGNGKFAGDPSPSKDPSGVGNGAGNYTPKTRPLLLFDASHSGPDSLSSAKVKGGLTHELIQSKQSVTSQHCSGLFGSTLDNRKQASVFHDFIHSNYVNDRHVATCDTYQQDYDSVDLSKISKAHKDTQANEHTDVDSELVLALPSERQASNESCCASSLTTQAVSVDACANDGKSDATDSEVSKEVENCDRGGFMATEGWQAAHHVSWQMAGGGSAMSDLPQCKATGAAAFPPTPFPWKGPLESPALGAAWAMLSMPLLWGPPTDRGLLWGLPWGPTASAVDAAKAALIPNTRALQKPQALPSMELAQKCQTVSDKQAEKSGQELPSMPLLLGPSTDRGLLWGLPWAPTASAVDAAKAVLIPNTRALQKPQSESQMDLLQKSLTVSNKEFEKSGPETSAPSEMRVWVPKTLRIKDADEAARSSIWSTLGITDKQGSLVSGKVDMAFQCDAKEVDIAAVKRQNANPAALSHSMAFQESS